MVKHLTRTVLAVFLLLCSLHACAQPRFNEVIFLFDENWEEAADISAATYFMQVVQTGDTVYKCRYYRVKGPMVKEETYSNADLSIPNGRFCWYDQKGNLDSTGMVYKGKKEGYWVYNNDSLKQTRTEDYDKGHLLERRDFVSNTYTDENGHVADLKEKIAADREQYVADSIAQKLVLVEAVFKGKTKNWSRYIGANVSTPDRLSQVYSPGKYSVIICFVVNKQGETDDLFLTRSSEWSADAEVFRIIRESPKWQPATRNGQPVVFRQLQTVTFQVAP